MVSFFQAVGIVFWIVAGFFLNKAVQMDTTIRVPQAEELLGQFDGVANLQLMHIQAMSLHLSLGCAIIGTLILCTTAIVSRGAATV